MSTRSAQGADWTHQPESRAAVTPVLCAAVKSRVNASTSTAMRDQAEVDARNKARLEFRAMKRAGMSPHQWSSGQITWSRDENFYLRHYQDHLEPILEQVKKFAQFKHNHMPDIPIIGGSAQRPHKGEYILADHGYGYALPINQPGWAGSDGWERCRLFLCPNEAVAERWRERYPDTPAEAIGCPKLDKYHKPCECDWCKADVQNVHGQRTAAIAFHWDCQVHDSVRSAWSHYQARLEEITTHVMDQGYNVVLHGHPRSWPTFKARYSQLHGGSLDNQIWSESDDVLRLCDVVITDHTSLLAEASALGKRVLFLSAPWYDAWHIFPELPRVHSAEELLQVQLDDLPRNTWSPYAYNDPWCAIRAAVAIRKYLGNVDASLSTK